MLFRLQSDFMPKENNFRLCRRRKNPFIVTKRSIRTAIKVEAWKWVELGHWTEANNSRFFFILAGNYRGEFNESKSDEEKIIGEKLRAKRSTVVVV
jgi:hypothetical protein